MRSRLRKKLYMASNRTLEKTALDSSAIFQKLTAVNMQFKDSEDYTENEGTMNGQPYATAVADIDYTVSKEDFIHDVQRHGINLKDYGSFMDKAKGFFRSKEKNEKKLFDALWNDFKKYVQANKESLRNLFQPTNSMKQFVELMKSKNMPVEASNSLLQVMTETITDYTDGEDTFTVTIHVTAKLVFDKEKNLWVPDPDSL